MENENNAEGVGQDGTQKEVVEKYDAEHGKYVDGMSNPPSLPNASPAAPDPSPFKVGGI